MLEKNGNKHILMLLHMIFLLSLFYILNSNNLKYNNYVDAQILQDSFNASIFKSY